MLILVLLGCSPIIYLGIKKTNFKSLIFLFGLLYTFPLGIILTLIPPLSKWLLIPEVHSLGIFTHAVVIWVILIAFFFIARGILPFIKLREYQNGLNKISIKNAQGEPLKLTYIKEVDSYHTVAILEAKGIGVDQLRKNKTKLESVFSREIIKISPCRNRSFVKVSISTKELPKTINFKNVQSYLKPDGHFLLGESKLGVINGELLKLPHLLIAGTTGMGKSICFKQILLGLLLSTPRIQLYLIDLKGGIEFREFARLPNIKMVKTIENAVLLLQKIKQEMQNRFAYIEKKNISKIDFKRDNFDFIAIGIDESSVLYAKTRRDHHDYELIQEARELTEEIAKLSRASGISLILATQKVTKETIDTRIQENISGRIAFKLNTPEGSVRVLGNSAANHLDAIPGRGIWQFGTDQVEFQAPFLSNRHLKEMIDYIQSCFDNNQRPMPHQMISLEVNSKSKSQAIKTLIQKEAQTDETFTTI